MSDSIEDFKSIKNHKKALRDKYGEPCPMCKSMLPKALPAILLPQQVCKIHGYRDPRPQLTNEQWIDQ